MPKDKSPATSINEGPANNEGPGVDLDRYRRYCDEGVIFDQPRHGVLRLTFSRPERWNTMPLQLHHAWPRMFAEIAEDDDIRAFILSGSGKVFSSGGDISETMWRRDAAELISLQHTALRIITRLLEIPQPTICVVNGPAIGLAASIALNFDFIICSECATFYDSHAAFGAAPGDGLALIAPLALGPAIAREFLYGGKKILAQEALNRGLVNRVVSHEQVEEESLNFLDSLQRMAPLAVKMGKIIVNAPLRAKAEEVLSLALAVEMITLASEDYHRAIEGFKKDRHFPDDWLGR
jgi:enoyl-CoA hydratase